MIFLGVDLWKVGSVVHGLVRLKNNFGQNYQFSSSVEQNFSLAEGCLTEAETIIFVGVWERRSKRM